MNCCCKDRDCDYNPCDKPAKWEVEILYTPPHGLTYYLCEKHFSEMEQFLHPYDNVKRIGSVGIHPPVRCNPNPD